MGNSLFRTVHTEAIPDSNFVTKTNPEVRDLADKARNEMATTTEDTSLPASPSAPPAPPPGKFTEDDLGPGNVEDLHRKCKDVFPTCFDGAKFMLQKGLNQHFQVSHTLSLGAVNNHYRFGATYVGTKQLTPAEAYPVLLADTDVSGNVTATAIHHFTDRLRGKFASQIQKNQFVGAQGSLDYRGRLANYGLTMANTDLVNESGVLVSHYLRRVFPRLDVGLEWVYQYSRQIPGGMASALSYAARYTGENFVASGKVGTSQIHATYYHNIPKENIQIGVEWESNFRLQESVASIAYQMDLPKADVVFRASLDTQWNVGGVLEKKLPPLPFTFAISGRVNHEKNQAKFGIGLILG